MESVADRQFASKSRRRRCWLADNALRTCTSDVVVIHTPDALTNRCVHRRRCTDDRSHVEFRRLLKENSGSACLLVDIPDVAPVAVSLQ